MNTSFHSHTNVLCSAPEADSWLLNIPSTTNDVLTPLTAEILDCTPASNLDTPSSIASNSPHRVVIPSLFLADSSISQQFIPMPGASTEIPIFTGPSSAAMHIDHIPRGHPQYILSPLTPGGFLYEKSTATTAAASQQSHPQQQQHLPVYYERAFVPPFPQQSAPATAAPSQFVAPSVELMETYLTNQISSLKSRQEKLAKLKAKRTKRQQQFATATAASIDRARSERAQQRTRVMGQFAPEDKHQQDYLQVMMELEASQRESQELQRKLEAMQKELALLREHASKAHQTEQQMRMQLLQQQQLNNQLRAENDLLWKTVPTQDVFSTINNNPFVDVKAFKEKIDLAEISLNSRMQQQQQQQSMPIQMQMQQTSPVVAPSCSPSAPSASPSGSRHPTLHRRNYSS